MLKRPLITPSKFRVPRSIFFCNFKGRPDYFIFVVNKLVPFIRVSYINDDVCSKLKVCVRSSDAHLKHIRGKETLLKLDTIMVVPTLQFECENWTLPEGLRE